MDRRKFIKGAAGVAVVPGAAHATPGKKRRVCVLGVNRAVMAADPILWTEPLWLDEDRFELSVLLVAWKTWGPGHTHIGAFGEVPDKFMRPWGDLSWMPADLQKVDFAVVLVDLWSDAREAIAANVITLVRRHVPKVLTVALQPWQVSDGTVVPDQDPRISEARLRVFSASDGVLWIQDDGAREERLALEAHRAGRCLEQHICERLWRRAMWAETDRLAAPVIRMFARASRSHFLPSHASSIA